MAQPGERRFTFRLYEDNLADVELLEKLDRLIADGRFRNKNEVLRKGIALVCEACYGADGGSHVSAGFTKYEIREASRMIAEEVISRIGERIPEEFECRNLPEETEKITDGMASFLAGLNAGG